MGLNDIDSLDDLEHWSNSVEVSEKTKEKWEKSRAWQKAIKKDEKKSQFKDEVLYKYLVEILKDKKYDSLIDEIVKSLYLWIPSSFILWIVSIIYKPISDEIRKINLKDSIEFNYSITENYISFDSVNSEIKSRLNLLIEDIIMISKYSPSEIITSKIIENLKNDEYIIITWNILKYFLNSLKIEIDELQLKNISVFILQELEKELKTIRFENI